MSSLISNFNSEYVAAANVLTNRTKNIIALVEDEYDIPFWNDLLNNNSQGLSFEITPYHNESSCQNTVKGKRHLLELKQNLGPNLIVCVDSDYDHLLPELTNEAQIINSSDYILQTYVYSIENYNCHASTLNKVCTNCIYQAVNFTFEEFLIQYSQTIYPLFIWSLFFEIREYGNITTLPRTEAIKYMVHNNSIIKIGADSLLKKIENKVNDKIRELENIYFEYINDIEALKIKLQERGLTSKNTYLFVRGHNLQHFLIYNLLKPIQEEAYNKHLKKISALTQTDNEKKNQIERFKNLKQETENIIPHNFDYKNHCQIFNNYLKISLENIFSKLEREAS